MSKNTESTLPNQGYYIVAALDDIQSGTLDNYGSQATDSILARGGTIEAILESDKALEGDVVVERLVLIRFLNRTAALDWYSSAEYTALIPERHAGSITRFVTGFDQVF